VPTQFAITPREGGNHLVSLRELAHNRWCGLHWLACRTLSQKSRLPHPDS
jgi:hypothetical protein